MHDQERDERIARLIGAVRADADPALWTRARARIEARERGARGGVAWLMRPMALAGSLAVLAVALVTSAALVVTAPRSASTATSDSLEDALVSELETAPAHAAGTAPVHRPAPASDSGAYR